MRDMDINLYGTKRQAITFKKNMNIYLQYEDVLVEQILGL